MSEAVLRPFREGDEASINSAFNEVFSLRRTLEEWHWKYPARPFGRFIMLTVADDGRVLVHYAAVPVRFKVGDEVVQAGQVVDVFSVAQARAGLAAARTFLKTADAFFATYLDQARLSVCYGFPSLRHLKVGVLGSVYAHMPSQTVTVLRRRADLKGRWLLGHRVRQGFVREAVDELWSRARARIAIGVERDGAWLQRRFTGRPGVDYLHLSAWRHGRVSAWAVLRLGGRAVSWAELVWDGEDPRALAALDRAAGRAARKAGAECLEMWLDADREATTALGSLGWKAEAHPLVRLVVPSAHPRVDASAIAGSFYVTMSDADLV